MTPQDFINELQTLTFDNAFNPYTDHCPKYDLPNAPALRSNALLSILQAAVKKEIHALWIGQEPGYQGARRTGLAFTDEPHLQAHGNRWSLLLNNKFTKGGVVTEPVSTYIWESLSQINEPIFLWNAFPLQSYQSGNPYSNRSHNDIEGKSGEKILEQLIQLLKPKELIAIGNDAENAVKRIDVGVSCKKVRHPSYGGHIEFAKQIAEIYDLPAK